MPKQAKRAKTAIKTIKKVKHAKKAIKKAKENPEVAALMTSVVPGVGGYIGSRLVSKITAGILAKNPSLSKIANYVESAVSVVLALTFYLLKGKLGKFEKYREGVLVGTSIAAIQTLLKNHMPGLAVLAGVASPPVSLTAGPETSGGPQSEVGQPKEQTVIDELLSEGSLGSLSGSSLDDGIFDDLDD